MTVTSLAIIYGTVGLGCILALWARGRVESKIDLVLLLVLWPLLAPFIWLRQGEAPATASSQANHEFLVALERARGTPLSALLPDVATGAALATRLQTAEKKLDEIDALLRRPDFNEEQTRQRQRALDDRGDRRAAAIAAGRVQSILRLRALRDRFRRDLEEVRELLAQLRIHAEVVCIAQAYDDDTRSLVYELVARVEGLDELLDNNGALAAETSRGEAGM